MVLFLRYSGHFTCVITNAQHQIGFLTEWQLYAQKIEGDAWIGEKIDEGKLQKMSGTSKMFAV